MKATNVALLLYATFAIEAATAATQLGNTAVEVTLSEPTATTSQTTAAPTTRYNATERPFSYSRPPSISSPPSIAPMTSVRVNDINATTLPSATESIFGTGEPSQISMPIHGLFTNSSATARGNADEPGHPSGVPMTGGKVETFPTNSSSLITTTSTEPCSSLPSDRAVTEYSIIYTSTITFYGNSTDYTPPYSPLTTPNYCSPTGEALITFYSTTHVSNSTAIETASPLTTASPTADIGVPALVAPIPAITFSFDLPEILTQTPDATGGDEGGIIITIKPYRSFTRRIITFITTDKNPAVVFSPEPTPDYSPTWITGIGEGVHKTIDVINSPPTDTPISNNLIESVKRPPAPTFQVTAGGDQVIINEETISGLKPSQTTTITVGTDVFTILPTAVVGFGSTVTKPAPQEISTPTSAITSGVLGGIPVIISGTKAVVDGTTLSISPQMATTTINGHKVALGTGTIAIDHETLVFQNPSPRPTHEIITGGEMITVIGSSIVVLHSTTITYGANIALKQTTFNGETISIGPRGISFHGTTLGGPSANSTNTEYEIVGGVTVGKLLPSLVVVNGETYSINKDGDLKNMETTIIANQTITIGPEGLILSSQTLTYPGSSVTATLSPSMPDFPAETASQSSDEESGAFSIRQKLGAFYVCLALVGVWVIFRDA
ncbi:hypothetical protein TRIATDRAFT_85690 [Trichoderma atroviride IMI 206040]|uniref:Uncharacterized protein n=1 Tax=Hypocrea atroviridis (strain ATCC 20476 / IMI 206040) TaxID=452589 RepID=G9P2I7_HYPAI|nr:uncharacterized protein TRIATDRAFT_85690 [Trichoderma atroviride IMI 206040]EHK43505.1 hypothetical protein TRIATDRAFT_85690 [Trichoderma atroviride IMI 206040]